jgi:hypothetical protein
VADRPLRPATDRRLGKPLPHLLANPPQSPPLAPAFRQGFFSYQHRRTHAVLATLSSCYSPLKGRSTTCYSPVRHYPSEEGPFDLHVLSTPPAFVLSQDQTLQTRKERSISRSPLRTLLSSYELFDLFEGTDCFYFLFSNSSVVKVLRAWPFRRRKDYYIKSLLLCQADSLSFSI